MCRARGTGEKDTYEIEPCRFVQAKPVLAGPPARPGWEYRLIEVDVKPSGHGTSAAAVNGKMNELGAEGWEYVEEFSALLRRRGNSSTICLLFKRRR